MVSVAVLPPRLPPGMAPPSGLGAAGTMNWDERVNWSHNEPIDKPENPSKAKKFLRKSGLTTQRAKANPDLPPFTMRQVPYDVWRKHYAKDKDGNYRGTHAPAEDCLLKPDDVQKWRLGEAKTQADRWTRGSEVLPVYAEVKETAAVPEYEYDYDGPPRMDALPAIEEPRLEEEDARLAEYMENRNKRVEVPVDSATAPSLRSQSNPTHVPVQSTSGFMADGKSTAEIIEEARARGKPKRSWRDSLSAGLKGTMGP